MFLKTTANQRLIFVIVLYTIFAAVYSVVVPIGRGADEWAHYWYAGFISRNGRLPASPVEREVAGYKSDWPPLYHLAAAALTGWINTDGPPTFKYRQDNVRRQLVPAMGPEAILHTEDERFPWQQEILVWHLGRFLSIVFSAGTLVVTYFIAVEVVETLAATSKVSAEQPVNSACPPSYIRPTLSPQILGLTAVSFLAFNPRFLFTGMLFSYDSLTLLLSTIFLWMVIRVVKGCLPRWGFFGLGTLAGLALITKYLAAPLLLIIFILALRRKTRSRGATKGIGIRPFIGQRLRVTCPVLCSTFHIPPLLGSIALPLAQAVLAFTVVTGWWFSYLILNFNEIDTYGPVLGTVAPLLRGDGSDRTVEQIFAWFGGAQSPAHIDRQSYTFRQIAAELPTTFWGNPIVRPYPLSWFVWLMTVVTVTAAFGLVQSWRSLPTASLARFILFLLLLYCALPIPFMLIRLFGARDALEAVQGRHILFLAGPAFAILLVWGMAVVVGGRWVTVTPRNGVLRATFYAIFALLLAGSAGQLLFMRQIYPPLLPVQTIPFVQQGQKPQAVTLDDGASLLQTALDDTGAVIKVTFTWQGGIDPAPEDYQLELALVNSQGQTYSSWLGYQTQARYPTRAWEAGDVIQDVGWLPLAGVPAADYEIRWRILGSRGAVVPWQTLASYTLVQPIRQVESRPGWELWHNGLLVSNPPRLRERETVQLTIIKAQPLASNPPSPISAPQLVGPDRVPHLPASSGPIWANFIVEPDWAPGDYMLAGEEENVPLLRVVQSGRNFTRPDIWQPLEVNFENKIKLLGYNLPSRRVQPGDGLPLTVFWQGLEWMGEDFVIFARLLDNNQLAWGGYDRLAQESYSTLLWAPGEIVTDGFAVPIAPDAPAGIYTLSLGWYRRVKGQAESLHLHDAGTYEATEVTAVAVGPIKVGQVRPGIATEPGAPQTALDITLGETVKLAGFGLAYQSPNGPVHDEAASAAGSSIDLPVLLPVPSTVVLRLYWQPLAQVQTDYTVFVHVRDDTGEIVAQMDRPPLEGAYPTSLWDPGELIADEITIPLDQLKPGMYELVVGMYDFSSGQRLSIENSPDDTIILQSFEVIK